MTEVMTGAVPRAAVLVPPPSWGAGEETPPEVFEGLTEDALLSELEGIERLTAWLAARATSITERLVVSREERGSRPRTSTRQARRSCIARSCTPGWRTRSPSPPESPHARPTCARG